MTATERETIPVKLVNTLNLAFIALPPQGKPVYLRRPAAQVHCQTENERVGAAPLPDGNEIPVMRILIGEPVGLPEPDGVSVFITNRMVAEAAWGLGRTDVVYGDPVRENGRIVGSYALVCNPILDDGDFHRAWRERGR
jgi:hypothetical protein